MSFSRRLFRREIVTRHCWGGGGEGPADGSKGRSRLRAWEETGVPRSSLRRRQEAAPRGPRASSSPASPGSAKAGPAHTQRWLAGSPGASTVRLPRARPERRQICCLIPAPRSLPAAALTMLSAMAAAPVSGLGPRAAAACLPKGLAAPASASLSAPASRRRRHLRSSFAARLRQPPTSSASLNALRPANTDAKQGSGPANGRAHAQAELRAPRPRPPRRLWAPASQAQQQTQGSEVCKETDLFLNVRTLQKSPRKRQHRAATQESLR
ncbi:hypothetical protein NN561_018635 [Cricetulus griseus]